MDDARRSTGTGNRPIFIVGSPRSGTTLLRLILDSHSKISCGAETHYLLGLAPIVGGRWDAMSRYGFDREYWLDKIAAFHSSAHEEYAQRRGKARWADKTPQYGRILGFLDELYPDCQMIHVIRNGLDVVASHKDRWGYGSARGATRNWRDDILTIRDQAAALPETRYTEVRYESLVAEPEKTVRAVLEFLGEDWEDGIIDYEQHDHGRGTFGPSHTSKRRDEGGEASTVYRSRVGVGGKELDPLLRLLFRKRSGKLQRELGYR